MTGRVDGGDRRRPAMRVLAAIADPKLEASLIPDLVVGGRLRIDTCASARELLESLRESARGWGAILTHDDLPHLHAGALEELVRRGLPLVILARDPEDARWSGVPAVVLPHDATPREIEEGLEGALAGERRAGGAPGYRQPRGTVGEGHAPPADLVATRSAVHAGRVAAAAVGAPEGEAGAEAPWAATVYTVASGAGAPGRTTVALALATALGGVAPTLLIDADLAGPSVAAHLDADPSKNLYMLAGAAPRTAAEWDRALAEELLQLGTEAPQAMVLCGVPRGGRGGKVTPQFLGRALDVLGRRFRHIVVDVGADLAGGDGAAALHRAAVTLADHVLLVGSGEIPGLRRQLDAFEYLLEHLRVERRRVALVVNRHDRATDHPPAEIERAFGQPLAALVLADYRAVKRALAAQHSVVLERRSRAAAALLELAARAHGAGLSAAVARAGHAHRDGPGRKHPAPAPGASGGGRRGWRLWPGARRRADTAGGD